MNGIIKRIISSFLVLIVLCFFFACAKKRDADYFRDIIIKADVGANIANVSINEKQVHFTRNLELYVCFDIYSDEYTALTRFQSIYSTYEKSTFTGSPESKIDKKFGYFTLNGETQDESFSGLVGYYYGGWYFDSNVYAVIYTTVDSDENRSEVDRILNLLKFPKPKINVKSAEDGSSVSSVTNTETTESTNNSTKSEGVSLTGWGDLKGFGIIGSDIFGVKFDEHNSVYAVPGEFTATYNIDFDFRNIENRDFKTLKLYIGLAATVPSEGFNEGSLQIYADDKLIYEKLDFDSNTKTFEETLEISNCRKLTFHFNTNGLCIALFEPTLYR